MDINSLQSLFPRVWLRKGSFSANVLTLTAGTALAQAVSFVGTIVLARMLTPSDFGILALFVAITSFLSAVGSWCYEVAIVLPEKDEEAANVLVLSLLILFGMSGLSLFLVALFRHGIAGMLNERGLASFLWGVPISIFFGGLYLILNSWCTRMKQFHRLAIVGVSQSLGTIGGQLGFIAAGLGGPKALVLGYLAGQAFGTAILAAQVPKENGNFLRRSFDWASVRSGFFKYKKFPIYTAPYGFLATVGKQLVFIVLRVFSSIQVVGLFSMASKAIYLPWSLLGSSMVQVFYPKAAAEMKSGRLGPFVLRILKLQVAFGTPALAFFVFEAKPLFRFVLGDAWMEAGSYAALLALAGYVGLLTVWMDRIFVVQARQDLSLIWQVSRDILTIGALAIALWLSGNPILSIGIYVALDFLCTVVWLVMVFKIANFAVKSLWQVGALFVGMGSVPAALFLAAHAVFNTGQAFLVSVLILLVMEVFVFVKYASRAQTL